MGSLPFPQPFALGLGPSGWREGSGSQIPLGSAPPTKILLDLVQLSLRSLLWLSDP